MGCEYGTEGLIKHILDTELEPVDLIAAFEESIRDRYLWTTGRNNSGGGENAPVSRLLESNINMLDTRDGGFSPLQTQIDL